VLWAFLSATAFIVPQLLTGLIKGFAIGLGVELRGWPESTYNSNTILISVISWVPGIICLLLVFRYLDRVPPVIEQHGPPPPPTFDHDPK
jgi:hypothetical protein